MSNLYQGLLTKIFIVRTIKHEVEVHTEENNATKRLKSTKAKAKTSAPKCLYGNDK